MPAAGPLLGLHSYVRQPIQGPLSQPSFLEVKPTLPLLGESGQHILEPLECSLPSYRYLQQFPEPLVSQVVMKSSMSR